MEDYYSVLKEQADLPEAALMEEASVEEMGESARETVPEPEPEPEPDDDDDDDDDEYSYLYNSCDARPRRQKKYDAERSASKRGNKKTSQNRKAMKKACKKERGEEDRNDFDC